VRDGKQSSALLPLLRRGKSLHFASLFNSKKGSNDDAPRFSYSFGDASHIHGAVRVQTVGKNVEN
jgi:hypothetical protein